MSVVSQGPSRTVTTVVLVVATALALLPLVPVFGMAAVVAPVVGGLLAGAALALVSARLRWSVLVTAAAAVVVYLVIGTPLAVPSGAVAGVLPSVDSLVLLLTGAVTVWKQVLTLDPSLGAAGNLLVAPLLLAFLGTLGALGVALRTRWGAWAAVVPVVVLGLSVLLGTKETVAPVAAGLVLVGLLLTWASWQAGTLHPRRLVALGMMTALVAVVGAAGGTALGEQRPRFVLRDELVPPFDPRDHPSPLSAFRRYVKEWKETDLVTVRGLPEDAYVRLATMDAFDGVVWNVAGADAAEGSGQFRRVGETIAPTVRGEEVEVDIEVHDLPSVWLPTVGYATEVEFRGPDAAALRESLRYNDATGTAVLTDGLPRSTRYTVRAVVPEIPSDDEVSAAGVASVSLPDPVSVPDAVPLFAGEIAGTATSPGLIALSLESGLAEQGWFSHGLNGETQSFSGHGADRLTTLLTGDLMVGDAEQYASAMALMAREMGLPARVVLGFVPEGTEGSGVDEDADGGEQAEEAPAVAEEITITGDDIQAWVEIDFVGHGWVPFFPTPPESKTPEQDTPEEESEPEPQVRQPPPPPEDPVRPPDDDTEQPQTQDSDESSRDDATWRLILTVVVAVVLPLALLVLPVLLVLAAKDRRRRRRRTAGDGVARVVGGWDEVLDLARDLRHPSRPTATRRETAVELASAFGSGPRTGRSARPPVGGSVAVLAAGADAAVFGAGDPPDDQVEEYWRQVDVALEGLRESVPRGRRLRARLSLASLRARR